jgi:hypothetical protein
MDDVEGMEAIDRFNLLCEAWQVGATIPSLHTIDDREDCDTTAWCLVEAPPYSFTLDPADAVMLQRVQQSVPEILKTAMAAEDGTAPQKMTPDMLARIFFKEDFERLCIARVNKVLRSSSGRDTHDLVCGERLDILFTLLEVCAHGASLSLVNSRPHFYLLCAHHSDTCLYAVIQVLDGGRNIEC